MSMVSIYKKAFQWVRALHWGQFALLEALAVASVFGIRARAASYHESGGRLMDQGFSAVFDSKTQANNLLGLGQELHAKAELYETLSWLPVLIAFLAAWLWFGARRAATNH
jgi:hypothetical protein